MCFLNKKNMFYFFLHYYVGPILLDIFVETLSWPPYMLLQQRRILKQSGVVIYRVSRSREAHTLVANWGLPMSKITNYMMEKELNIGKGRGQAGEREG